MKYNLLGNSDLNVSVITLGALNFGSFCDEETSINTIRAAIDNGVNCIDTAPTYGGMRGNSEEITAKAIKNDRDKIIIATKFGTDPSTGRSSIKGGGTKKYITHAVEESLKRLGTDYIDLYQMHFPDNETPIDETLEALHELIQSGKIRYIGSSSFASWQISEAGWTAVTKEFNQFISMQNRYSILNRDMEKEIVPVCKKHNVSLLPFFPLESGLLTGKFKRNEEPPKGTRLALWKGAFSSESKFDTIDKINEFGKKINRNLLEISLAWVAQQDQVGSVLVGATSPDQIKQNIDAISWEMTESELEEVNKAVLGN
ncbi:MAG: aldo/keto reductase [Gammaproteobacteria bacterium]|jgi:aryl-alcohol dehydrogenase-like predicted oxidoreductase|nr:aldo/keto reductase [Gammaproteobacteria bacterium]MBT5217451.1 aldo/keto reductase [Gammaproteobacteria bacterium]MBT5541892.1 aldo/keto reductase [Gammaproteobacteria bacterium]MBT6074337.1 aldo/keto reductase [Gammaproteobacteria bacterium]MBT7754118.1 aldo/keto reductase [Gammaproteobacteria bacterium]